MFLECPSELSFIKKYLTDYNSYFLSKLGGFKDGGYVADYRSILMSQFLFSGGVGSNVRFESDFYEINKDLKVVLIDPTVSVTRMFLRSFYHFLKPHESGFRSLSEVLNYLYFKSKNTLIRKFLSESFGINNLFKDFNILKMKSIFLKLDIEGYEYHLLEDIVNKKNYFTGVCIEFHDLHEEQNRIKLKTFLENLQFKILNISINEVCIQSNGFPSVLEMSLCPIDIDWPSNHSENSYLQNSNSLHKDLVAFK